MASREIKVLKAHKVQMAPVDPKDPTETRETLESKVFVANLVQLANRENKVYLVSMVLMVHKVLKVHKVHVVKTGHKDDQEKMDSQVHKVHRVDAVLLENVVPEDLKVMPDLKVKRVNPQLSLDHQVLMDDQDLRVLPENEDETVLMVFKGQEDHKDQEENQVWLDHPVNTITINCESLFQKL